MNASDVVHTLSDLVVELNKGRERDKLHRKRDHQHRSYGGGSLAESKRSRFFGRTVRATQFPSVTLLFTKK